MLVLSRKVNEALVFPGIRTKVRIRNIRGKTVSLAIDAPKEITILREELDNNTENSLLIAEELAPLILQLETQLSNNTSKEGVLHTVNMMKILLNQGVAV